MCSSLGLVLHFVLLLSIRSVLAHVRHIWTEIVQTRRLRLAGHVLRLPDIRPAHVAMTWIPESGRRTSGRPQMTWRTSFKEDLHRMSLTWRGARRAANDRHQWRNLVAQCPVRDRRN